MDVFPDNKIGSYHLKLPQAVDLHSDWEVGLHSISYLNTWYTLRKLENHLYYSTKGCIFSKSASVDFGYYDTVKDLIDAINKTVLAAIGNDSIHMEFNPRTSKVKVYIKKKHGLAFFGKLSRKLGFGGHDTKLFKTTESPFVADLFGITAIYVYCNIVQPQIVGNTNVHLLRTIPVGGKSAKALGNVALTSGVNLLGDVNAGISVKQAARTRALEGANAAKMQAIQRAQRYAQTGRGHSKSSRRSTKKRKASRTKRRAKKRKASASATTCKPTKRARTSPRDIFG